MIAAIGPIQPREVAALKDQAVDRRHPPAPTLLATDAQPVTARLAAAGSRRAELEALLNAAPTNAQPSELRWLVVDQNVTGKSSMASRIKVWQQLRQRYVLDPAVPEYRAFIEGLRQASGPRDRGLFCFLLLARTDRLIRLLTLAGISPLLSRSNAVVEPSVLDERLIALAAEYGLAWTEVTMVTLRRHALSALKDFGLLAGSAKKRVVVPRPGPAVTLFAARLARLEGLSDRQVLDACWFRLLGLSAEHTIDLLYAASRAGLLEFRMQAEVVELILPPVEAE